MGGQHHRGTGNNEESRLVSASKVALAVAIGASLALAAIAFLAATRSISADSRAAEPEEAAAMAAFSMFAEP